MYCCINALDQYSRFLDRDLSLNDKPQLKDDNPASKALSSPALTVIDFQLWWRKILRIWEIKAYILKQREGHEVLSVALSSACSLPLSLQKLTEIISADCM